MRQQFTMLVPLDLVISNNRTAQVWKRQKVKDGIKALTREAAKDRYPCGKASIYVGIEKRTKGAYDPVNLSDTFKACVDELVNMGILDEDDYHHVRSEEHTSELQSRFDLVCRLLLEKKKKT